MDSATQICLMFIKHKSTLAQLLLALLAPTNGSIELYSDQKTHDQVVGDKKVNTLMKERAEMYGTQIGLDWMIWRKMKILFNL